MPSLFIAALMLQGCSKKDEDKYVERPVEELYNEGRNALLAEEYITAAKAFDEVERQHPYSDWAIQAQIMAAYAYYMDQSYDKALGALDTFIQLHPAHSDVPYAYYLQGLCYYEQLFSIERDQKITEMALDSFKELLRRFPTSKYAKDAQLKIHLLRDTLAAKEMHVGRYYQRKKAYLAAMNRFRNVVLKYQTTSHIEEALHRLVEVYLALGLREEAAATGAILGHNYPGSAWYSESYYLLKGVDLRPEEYRDNKKSWIEKVWSKEENPKSDKQ